MIVGTLEHARQRIASAIDEIERLKQSEFAYAHSRDALTVIEQLFRKQHGVLQKASPQAAPSNINTINTACSTSLYLLYLFVPVLGFILRSTNVRNAFEAYAPLLRLARSLLGDKTKLVIASEWEYSPFVYRPMAELPGFVLIGLPAPESSNPLLIPLAGHELGHSVWESEGYASQLSKKVEDAVLHELTSTRWADYEKLYPQYSKDDLVGGGDLFVRRTWLPAFTLAMQQVEEIFGDVLGLQLFSESYLYAFQVPQDNARCSTRM